MFKQLAELTVQLLTLARDIQQNKSDIKDVRQEVKDVRQEFKELRGDVNDLRQQVLDLTRAVERLAYEIHRVSEREESARKMMALELENEMLKFERRLPPGTAPKAEDSKG